MKPYGFIGEIPVASTLSPSLFWRVSERFRGLEANADALTLLNIAQNAVLRVANIRQQTIVGWAQNAGRSVVALTDDGQILKSPLLDGHNVARSLQLYSQNGTGAHVYATHMLSKNHAVSVMERVDGRFFHPMESPDVHELSEIVHIVRSTQPDAADLSQYTNFEVFLDRMMAESLSRMHLLDDTSLHEALLQLYAYIVEHDAPRVLCHGDLDLRNILHKDGDMRLIDPEPVVAPLEFDVAKICKSSGVRPEDFAAYMDVDVQLTVAIHQFLVFCGDLYGRVKTQEMQRLQ